jgi:hypothetical protein
MIVKSDGTVVKPTWLVAPKNFWTGVVAFKSGFCIRVGSWNPTTDLAPGSGYGDTLLVPPTTNSTSEALLFFYDNAGNCYATNTMAGSSGILWSQDGGRGDGAGLAADIRSPYVYYTDKLSTNNAIGAVGIWDGRTGAFVTNATWTTTDPSKTGLDRFGMNVDALNRFCVAVDMKADTSVFTSWQAVARVGQFDGTNISWLTPMFYPFVNHESDTNSIKNIQTSFCPYVMMTTKAICIAAKGQVNSTNNPAAGPDTANPTCEGIGGPPCVYGDTGKDRTLIYTIISHPAPVEAPRPNITVTRSGPNAIISWDQDAGLFTLQSTSVLPGGWANVSPQPATVGPTGGKYTKTVPIGSGNLFFRLAR